MTTATYSTTWQHTTNATFQAWGSALSAAMQSCGLSQTTDTGQINWTTVVIPATINTAGGYEIYKFTDALQSTSPVFLKIEYGTGDLLTGNGTPGMWLTVGQGSNGSGTLTGTLSARYQILGTYSNAPITSTTISYPTYICFDGSYLGVAFKLGGLFNGSSSIAIGATTFMVGRGVNTSGAYVANEISIVVPPATFSAPAPAQVASINTSSGSVYTNTTGYWAFVVYSVTSSAVGGTSFQLYPCWGAYNQATPLIWSLYGLNAEVAQGSTVSATPVGATSYTYLMTGVGSYGFGLPSTNLYSLLMKYQ